jgi:chitooligosaccharide deacetylase
VFWLLGLAAAVVLAHLAPFPFLLDVTEHTVWRMPVSTLPTIYLTFDAGPNTTTTPRLLDVLQKHEVSATFFVQERYLNSETRSILQRTFADGHAVALQTDTRKLAFAGWGVVATTLQESAARIEVWTGYQTCRAFRPQAGYRSVPMLMGAARAGYTVVGWSWKLNDAGWFRRHTADTLRSRLVARATPGDIIAMRDGHPETTERSSLVPALDRAIPQLKRQGVQFGTICP